MVYTTEFVMNKKQIASIALAFWLTIIALYMLLVHQFIFEIFFVLGFLGILVIAEIMSPRYVMPGNLRYINYLIIAGTVIFGAMFIQVISRSLNF
jgi:hypothetical protein